jgi:glycosyltransferase involved in cell wall biosynthesis
LKKVFISKNNKRIKLGLILSLNEQWIGGTYYILNLISALKTLPTEKQPLITILSKNISDFELAKETGYSFLQFRNPFEQKRNFLEKIIDKIIKITTGKFVIDKRVTSKDIDVLFPANNEYVFDKVEKKIYWFPDFQHIVYPDFFDADEIKNRNAVLKIIAESKQHLVLSSNAAKVHWNSLPINKNCSVNVIPFAVTHPTIDDIKIDKLLLEFNLEKKYFIVCNQFWAHKNHFVVLKAIALLKQENIDVQFLFTGKQEDYRNPSYFQSIKKFIINNNLEETIKLPGLIDRKKQLKLMQNSIAVIQPSFFEGWSTVVEDAKSLGCEMIVSDIEVHKEQLATDSALYFNAKDENDLVQQIKSCMASNKEHSLNNYEKNIQQFGLKFSELLEDICQ